MRSLTLEESHEIITRHIDIEDEFLSFKNHKKFDSKENTYRFTINLVSLDFLIALMEEESVENVFFSPSVPPPGSTTEGVSMRYKIYIQYYEVEE